HWSVQGCERALAGCTSHSRALAKISPATRAAIGGTPLPLIRTAPPAARLERLYCHDMKIPVALLADEANISQEGKLNIPGASDRRSAARFPTLQPRVVFVFRLQAE